MDKKQYNVLELSAMTRDELSVIAKGKKVDTLNKTKQTIIYEILDAQSSETVKS
jgi:hypothetical protein